jgi:hypothetical protein
MKATTEPRTSGTVTHSRPRRTRLRNLVGRASGAVALALATAGTLVAHLPGTARATRVGANTTTRALQRLPDSTLHGLAASSIGLGAGFYLAGLPRLVTAAAVTPAVLIGAAIVLRPDLPAARAETSA